MSYLFKSQSESSCFLVFSPDAHQGPIWGQSWEPEMQHLGLQHGDRKPVVTSWLGSCFSWSMELLLRTEIKKKVLEYKRESEFS